METKKKVLWISHHSPLQVQKEELERLLGSPVEIIRGPGINDEQIMDLIDSVQPDEIVVVLPYSVIYRINKRGIYPLYPEMVETGNGDYDLVYRGRKLKFTGFSRFQIKIEKHPPDAFGFKGPNN